ncbi:MAG: thioredoxin family protein [Bacteroidota bacterium]
MKTLSEAFQHALSYTEYVEAWRAHLAIPKKELDKTGRIYQYYALYNQGRSTDVTGAFAPSEAIQQALKRIDTPVYWLVLTEDWCGDSAFSLPVIVALAEQSEHVTLRILLRDHNLDLMDRYLTNGTRSIPKLVAFDPETGRELFQWGPRPAELAEARTTWKAEGADGKEITKRGVAWYEDGGWRQVEEELLALLTTTTNPVAIT